MGGGGREGQMGCGEEKKGRKRLDVGTCGFALLDNLAHQPPFIPLEMQAGKGRESL